MNVLILGGTQFVGRHIVEAFFSAGHVVSVLNRGRTPDELPVEVERLRGDRDLGRAEIAALRKRTWDACVDVSGYTPRQVRPSVEALRASVGRYVFVSAVSVYGDPSQTPVTEACLRSAPAGENVTDIDADTYGPLKVACEDIVERAYRERCTLLRPQIVAGPYDPIDRFSYWVRRATLPGETPRETPREMPQEMLAPGDGSDHLQFIDARDLARFTVTAVENDLSGAFNMAGPRLSWAAFIDLLGAPNVVWVPANVIRGAELTERELPLYRPEGGPRSSLMRVSNQRALEAGLTLTAPEVTVRDTRDWLPRSNLAPALSPELEAELIRLARATAARFTNIQARSASE